MVAVTYVRFVVFKVVGCVQCMVKHSQQLIDNHKKMAHDLMVIRFFRGVFFVSVTFSVLVGSFLSKENHKKYEDEAYRETVSTLYRIIDT
jgi:hypothetical protein